MHGLTLQSTYRYLDIFCECKTASYMEVNDISTIKPSDLGLAQVGLGFMKYKISASLPASRFSFMMAGINQTLAVANESTGLESLNPQPFSP